MTKPQRSVLVLESQLDKDVRSVRSQKEFMRILGAEYAHSGVNVITKEVHSKSDLKHFLGVARSNKDICLIHLIGHGRSTSFRLSNGERLDLARQSDLNLLRGLKDRFFLFSCCAVGNNQKTLDRIRQCSGAAAVYAYAGNLSGYQAFLIDALLYHLLLGDLPVDGESVTTKEIYERANNAIDTLWLYRRGKVGKKVLKVSSKI